VGLVMTVLVNVVAMAAALAVMLGYLDWAATPTQRAAWDAPALDPRLLLALVMIAGELALLTAIALFFSTFSSSALLSIVFTIGLFVTGLYSQDLRQFGDVVDVSPGVAVLVGAIGWAVPAFSAFDIKAQIVHGLALPSGFIALTLVYAALYTAALLVAAVALFSRREFK
jgi:Cu-processing system permease protein